MGAKKKLPQKVKVFYKGPEVEPVKVADEHEMKTIVTAFKDAIPKRDAAFETNWNGEKVSLKLIVGLSATLRCLRHKRSLAIIFDDTAGAHLTIFLRELARKAKIPILQAHRLIDLAPDISLKTLLVVSIVTLVTGRETRYQKSSQPTPNPVERVLVSEPLNDLCQMMQSIKGTVHNKGDIAVYKPPVLDKVILEGAKGKKKKKK